MATITINETDLVRVEGIPLFRMFRVQGIIRIQLKDGDRLRSSCRGSCFVEIPFDEFIHQLESLIEDDHEDSSKT